MQRPTGRINLIGLILTLAVVAFVYSCIFFAKPILDNLDVKEQMSAAYNQGTLLDDQAIKRFIEKQTESVGEHDADDGFGNIRSAPGLGLTDDDITVDRDTVAKTIVIRVDYARKVLLRPTTRAVQFHFHPQVAGPLIERR